MMKKLMILSVLGLSLMVGGCTDAQVKNWTTIGDPGTIILYSGGKEVGRWKSTGKIASESSSFYGCMFEDAETGKLIRVSGTTVVIN